MNSVPTKEEVQTLSLQALTDTYNRLIVTVDADARTIKLFKDRPIGIKRLEGVLVQLKALEGADAAPVAAEAPATQVAKVRKPRKTVRETMAAAPTGDAPAAADAPKTKRVRKTKVANGEVQTKRKGRDCIAAGKGLSAEHLIENMRREKTKGHASMQLVLDNPGIAFEEYLARGGRRKDVTRNLRKGFFKLVAVK